MTFNTVRQSESSTFVQTLNSQKTPISHPYRWAIECLSWAFRRKVTLRYRECTVPSNQSWNIWVKSTDTITQRTYKWYTSLTHKTPHIWPWQVSYGVCDCVSFGGSWPCKYYTRDTIQRLRHPKYFHRKCARCAGKIYDLRWHFLRFLCNWHWHFL